MITIPTENEIITGWMVGDVHVPPPTAYTDGLCWFNDFLWKFPKKAKRLREEHKKRGWNDSIFARYWMPVVIDGLNRNYP